MTLSARSHGAGKSPPGGVEPLFFTSTSQEIFRIRTGEDVTREHPHRYIPKQDILNDIQFRGVISDFHPVKDRVKEYPGDELLIVYDDENIYDQNFYLCVTLEAKEAEIKRLEDARRAALEPPKPAIDERKKTGGWASEGSEQEIAEEQTVATRDRIKLAISRKRKEFCISCKFSDKDAGDSLYECRPFKDANFELKRIEYDRAIQAVAEVRDERSQTTWNRKVNKTVQYASIDMAREEQMRAAASDALIDFLRRVAPKCEEALQQNETLNAYEDDFLALAEEDTTLGNKNDNSVKEYQSFTDLLYSKNKVISAIDWMPNSKGVLAVSCIDRANFEERVEISGKIKTSVVLIWNFIDPIHPQFVLESPSDVMTFRFNPKQPELIAAGCYNGQVVLWDISSAQAQVQAQLKSNEARKDDDQRQRREGQVPLIKPMIVSSVDASHRSSVCDLMWNPPTFEMTHKGKMVDVQDSTKCQQFATVAQDGQVMWWDLRAAKKECQKALEPNWTPANEVSLGRLDGTGTLGCLQLMLNTGEVGKDTTKEGLGSFYVTTEAGELVYCDLHKDERENDKAQDIVKQSIIGHYGPIVVGQRSPFFPDVLLSCGDWTFNIWKEGVQQPIFSSPFSPSYLTVARWSPTRPAVVITGKVDGSVDVWDLLDRSHDVSTTLSIASSPITSIEFWNSSSSANRQLMAVGDDHGTLHIMEMPRSLRRAVLNEKSIMQSFFAREVKRVAYMQERFQIRARDRPYKPAASAAEPSAASPAPADVTANAPAMTQTQVQEIDPDAGLESEYQKYEEKIKDLLGLNPQPIAAAS